MTTPTSLLPLFHPRNPYTGWTPNHDLLDLQGWNSDLPIFEQLIAELRPKIIVEVGTWKGASAIHMAKIAKRLSLPTQIICIDTWLGSPEHNLGLERDALAPSFGYPHLYYTFLNNVIASGVQDLIIPFPQTSLNAAKVLQELAISPDLIYLDAAHEYNPVLSDIRAYWRLLAPGGALLGDDYHPNWPGVMEAADDFAHDIGPRLQVRDEKYLFRKPIISYC